MSLSQKLGLHLILVTALFGVISTGFSRRVVHQVLVRQLYATLSSQAANRSADLAKAVSRRSEHDMLAEIRKVKDAGPAEQVSLISSSGDILAHEDVVSRGSRLPCRDFLPGWQQQGAPFVERLGAAGPFLDLVIPVYSNGGEPTAEEYLFEGKASPAHTLVGGLHMHFPLDTILSAEREMTRRILAVILFASAIGLGAGVLFTNRLLSPLKRLAAAAERIGKGELGVTIPASGTDETAELSRAFNRMSAALSETTISKDYLDSVLNSLGIPVLVVDDKAVVRHINASLLKLSGRPAHEVLDRPLDAVVLAAGRGPGQAEQDDYLLGAEGRIPVTLTTAPLPRPGRGDDRVIAVHDLREIRRSEELRSRTSKLESVGLMAGGIAHDFNNFLTVILGCGSLLRESLSAGHPALEDMGAIERAAQAARRLTQRLLTFAKGGAPVKETASLAEVVRGSVELALSGSAIKPAFSIADDLRPVEMDKGQMGEVLHNLAVNALQAMPEGGVLTVAARNREAAGGPPAVEVSVTDTGTGIPEAVVGKVFDPYFSTKPGGHGLGLAVCYAVVRNHGGSIAVSSRPGAGSTFTITLPASDKPLPRPAAAAPEPARAAAASGARRILVMDDEETVGWMLRRFAEKLGYEAHWVSDGEAAVAAFRSAVAGGRPFDLTVLDLTIPGGLGGKLTAPRLLALDPQAKILVSSGYSDDPVMASPREFGFVGVLPKPYTYSGLRSALQAALRPAP